ncbi:MAG: hypothetical protein B6D59_03455 [Campylobacteraceae bacterium 4484_4]|nr:MAG: hypothetical protein B6D59_03455 [Campylobacteraceae bacterium 4484_4]
MIYYLLFALLLVGLGAGLYFRYRDSYDLRYLATGAGWIILALFFTYATKILFVYKPILVLHLALLILSWTGVVKYITQKKAIWPLLLAPSVSLILFVTIALFFREN